MRRAVLLVLILSRFGIAICQQPYLFQHITTEDGLFANSRINLYQDKEGYYWFSSVQGLQRYDGRNLITWPFIYKRTRDLSDDAAVRPVEDKEGNIWTWNNEGISVFNKKHNKLERLYLEDASDSNTNNVTNVFMAGDGRLWIVANRDVLVYSDSLHKPVVVYRGVNEVMHALYDPKRNGIWMILYDSPHAFVFFDCVAGKPSRPIDLSLDRLFGAYNPLSLLKFDRDGHLWIADYIGDLCRYDLDALQSKFFDILHQKRWGNSKTPNSAVFDFVDDGSSIWFSADNYTGILRFSKSDGSFVSIQNDNGNQSGLHFQNECNNMLLDREDNIWINSDMGLNIFNPRRQHFKYLSGSSTGHFLPFSQDVTSFLEASNGDIWITTWGSGVFRYDSNFRLLRNYIHRDGDPSSLGEPLSKTWSLAELPDGNILVGCQYAVLAELNPRTGKFNNRVVSTFNKRTIILTTSDQPNSFWFGLHSGYLGHWDRRADKMTTIDQLYGPQDKINHAIDGLYTDKSGTIWCATGDDAIKSVDPVSLKVQTCIRGFHPLGLSGFGDSVILGGSFGNGLFAYNKYTKRLHFFTTDNGLSSNIVYTALADRDGDIWVVTNESIDRLDWHTGNVIHFGAEDGIRDHVFQRAAYQLKNGTILVAANSGVIYFNPARFRSDHLPQPVIITGIRVGQQDLPVDSLPSNRLAIHSNPLAISFGSPSFNERNSLTYSCRMVGADTNWLAAGKNRSVLYANIAPGHYQFQVKCQNREGLVSPVTQMAIVILPPWWATWWAWLLWAVLAVSIACSVYAYHRRTSKQLADVRQKIASDLHDDIGSTLNSISVYSEVARQQVDTNKENAIHLLKKMGAASRGMIDNMNDIVWAVNPKNDQFENVVQRMQFFAAELLSGKNILLEFQIDERSKKAKLTMEKRKNFYLIFKEAVTNAYKYSHATNVTVKIASDGGWLTMRITDDGNGFDPAGKNGTGNGLRNMQTRSKEVGAALSVSSAPAGGTTVQLKMGIIR